MMSEFTGLPIPQPERNPKIEGIMASPYSGIRRFCGPLFPLLPYRTMSRIVGPPSTGPVPQKPENLIMTPIGEEDIEELGIPASDELVKIFAKRREGKDKEEEGEKQGKRKRGPSHER